MCSEHSNTAGNDIDLNFEFETIQTRTCWSGSECRGPRLCRPCDCAGLATAACWSLADFRWPQISAPTTTTKQTSREAVAASASVSGAFTTDRTTAVRAVQGCSMTHPISAPRSVGCCRQWPTAAAGNETLLCRRIRCSNSNSSSSYRGAKNNRLQLLAQRHAALTSPTATNYCM